MGKDLAPLEHPKDQVRDRSSRRKSAYVFTKN